MVNGHYRRVDAVGRKLTRPDPEQRVTHEQLAQAISELEGDPKRSHVVGMALAPFRGPR